MFAFQKRITAVLLTVCLLSGLFLLYLGVSETIELNRKTRGYVTTQGYLLDFTLYSEAEYDAVRNEHKSATYQLIYNFTAQDGKEYLAKTDYGTGVVPAIGSTRKIYYNPQNPEEAVVAGGGNNGVLLFGGAMFTGVPLIFILAYASLKKKTKRKTSVDWMGVTIGSFFVLISYGILYIITGEASPSGIAAFYGSSFSAPLLIPPLLIFAGLFLLFKSLFWGGESRRGKSR